MEKKAWPYVAGLMDSEGCIGIYPTKRIMKGGTDNLCYSLLISISNKDRSIMKWLVANFGGSFKVFKNTRGFSENNPGELFHWKIFGKGNQEAFLLGMLPYLTVKRDQARVAVDYIRLGSGWANEERKQLSEECRRLKKAGSHGVVFEKYEDSIRNAYAAGLIDGDGTISSSQFAHDVIFYSTEFVSIKWMFAHYGGHFYTRSRPGFKDMYRWTMSGRTNKERMLLSIIPYLIIKKERAKLLLEILRAPKEDRLGLLAELKKLNCPPKSTATTDTIDIEQMKTQS